MLRPTSKPRKPFRASMHNYTLRLKTLFEQNANPSQAAPMKKYMRDQFEYLGIKTPQSKLLLKEFLRKNGLPALDALDKILRDLWSLPQRELQYVAMNLLDK